MRHGGRSLSRWIGALGAVAAFGLAQAAPAAASPTFVFRESYAHSATFHARFTSCIHQFNQAGGLASQILGQLNGAEVILEYEPGKGDTQNPAPDGDSTGKPVTVLWDPQVHGRYFDGAQKTSCGILLHELEHAARFFRGKECTGNRQENAEAYYYDEALGARAENWWLDHLGLKQRTLYGPASSVPTWARWPRHGTRHVPSAPPCHKPIICPTPKEVFTLQGFCEAPKGKIAAAVSIGFEDDENAWGTVEVSPAGTTVDSRNPPPGYVSNPGFYHDVFFWASEGTKVTVTANHGSNSYFDGWQKGTEIPTPTGVCDDQDHGSPSTCTFTVTDPYHDQRWNAQLTAFFLQCPTAPPSGTPRPSIAKDCPGQGGAGG